MAYRLACGCSERSRRPRLRSSLSGAAIAVRFVTFRLFVGWRVWRGRAPTCDGCPLRRTWLAIPFRIRTEQERCNTASDSRTFGTKALTG